jgi:hypothetical protein
MLRILLTADRKNRQVPIGVGRFGMWDLIRSSFGTTKVGRESELRVWALSEPEIARWRRLLFYVTGILFLLLPITCVLWAEYPNINSGRDALAAHVAFTIVAKALALLAFPWSYVAYMDFRARKYRS